jgi:hypothetical protein
MQAVHGFLEPLGLDSIQDTLVGIFNFKICLLGANSIAFFSESGCHWGCSRDCAKGLDIGVERIR